MDSSKLSQVINSIERSLEQLGSQVVPVPERMNNLVMELDNMTRLADGCNKIEVPMEVVNLIDDGENPDEFTRDLLNTCIAKNQIVKGKTDAFKALRSHLLEELDHAFPDQLQTYTHIRRSG